MIVKSLVTGIAATALVGAAAAGTTVASQTAIPTTGIQMAIAFVAILPIMLIFPLFSKYYAKGITMGAVKG